MPEARSPDLRRAKLAWVPTTRTGLTEASARSRNASHSARDLHRLRHGCAHRALDLIHIIRIVVFAPRSVAAKRSEHNCQEGKEHQNRCQHATDNPEAVIDV